MGRCFCFHLNSPLPGVFDAFEGGELFDKRNERLVFVMLFGNVGFRECEVV